MTTNFGFEKVDEAEKTRRVERVFASIAKGYDLVNDLASFGLHRLWKRAAIASVAIPPNARILDLAGGTGDLTRLFMTRYGDATVILSDINASMLAAGRDKLGREGLYPPTLQCDAEHLPFPDGSIDIISIGFGLRNVTNKAAALAEMKRALKPGGEVVILEFSKVTRFLRPLYDLYTFKILPKIGGMFTKDEGSYHYLAESIKTHPNQETLAQMMRDAGFKNVAYKNLTFGVVAIHTGSV